MDTEDRKPLILLVDDEAPLRRMLTILLTQSGFNVQAEGTGEGGLAAFDSARPDLVLLDVGLPDIDALVTMLIQADRFGTRMVQYIGNVFREHLNINRHHHDT